ncbi:small nuclear ribonucleoprotein G-like [Panthera leo]|uniref:small nuclear ribonucleoprotein G-like n=1 Tax=Panthera leo TaxID=9689 RepID=UPI001C6A7AE0|nr:small nuclear ribonucleoprotein G-like [Panthera leo]
MDKKLSLKSNGRHVQGLLQGFNPFMNFVIDGSVQMATSGQQSSLGMVVYEEIASSC